LVKKVPFLFFANFKRFPCVLPSPSPGKCCGRSGGRDGKKAAKPETGARGTGKAEVMWRKEKDRRRKIKFKVNFSTSQTLETRRFSVVLISTTYYSIGGIVSCNALP
jgi:hypothetical protein